MKLEDGEDTRIGRRNNRMWKRNESTGSRNKTIRRTSNGRILCWSRVETRQAGRIARSKGVCTRDLTARRPEMKDVDITKSKW